MYNWYLWSFALVDHRQIYQSRVATVKALIHNCASSLYALRVLRSHVALQTVYRAVVVTRLTYAISAWWGFTIANALNVFWDVELALVSVGLIGLVSRPSPRMLLMFSLVEFYAMEIICYTHCYKNSHGYNLRHRRHNRTLVSNHDQRNFIDRQLH